MQSDHTLGRVCGCLACTEGSREAGTIGPTVEGDCCGNCGFYAPFDETEASGVCCKFELRPGKAGMGLYHRRRGELRGQALIVGGSFACNSFRPFHDVPSPEAFWRSMPLGEADTG